MAQNELQASARKTVVILYGNVKILPCVVKGPGTCYETLFRVCCSCSSLLFVDVELGDGTEAQQHDPHTYYCSVDLMANRGRSSPYQSTIVHKPLRLYTQLSKKGLPSAWVTLAVVRA